MNQVINEMWTREELSNIARFQKSLLWAILGAALAEIIESSVMGSLYFSAILFSLAGMYFTLKLASSLRKYSALLYLIIPFAPLVLSSEATRVLRVNGIRGGPLGARMADLENPVSPETIKRDRRKQRGVFIAILASTIVFFAALFFIPFSGDRNEKPAEEPTKVYVEGKYFTGGSTKDEVLRIQGAPTLKTEFVWYYADSQVHFDSEGKVKAIWDFSKNLKAKPIEWKPYAP